MRRSGEQELQFGRQARGVSVRDGAPRSSKAHRWEGAQPNVRSETAGRESSALAAESQIRARP
ncbi:hypothetical protein [Streptomyces torulosus]|uniref:hypothetical protein n=1 Tax=Streptomyces torulosus TaxID=68276 RepID=UPI0006EBBFEE|nr:hypothetical protein [Streptomyces torulosus]